MGVKSRLGIMMILQYAVWGVWLPVLAGYLQAPIEDGGLGFTGQQLGWILGLAASSGAVFAPIIAGQIADRYFSAQKFLAFLLVCGGCVKYILSYQTSFEMWLGLSIVYSILFMPTLSLSNSVAFANLKDSEQEFPKVRVWGTIGWIAASWIFPWVFLQHDLKFQALPPFLAGEQYADATARLAYALKVSGVLSILYAGYCFMLPDTPPKKGNVESIAVLDAFGLIKKRSVLILVLASIPISIVHQLYFMQAFPYLTNGLGMEVRNASPAMSVGQFAEILVMAGLGTMLARIGFKFTLTIGCLAYVLRYAIWGLVVAGESVGSTGVFIAVASQALHGFCFACFFATGFIYIDRVASEDIRHSAQTVFGIVILGIGPIFAGPILGQLSTLFGDGNVVTNFSGMWLTLSAIAFVTMILVLLGFKDESKDGDNAHDIEAEAAVETV